MSNYLPHRFIYSHRNLRTWADTLIEAIGPSKPSVPSLTAIKSGCIWRSLRTRHYYLQVGPQPPCLCGSGVSSSGGIFNVNIKRQFIFTLLALSLLTFYEWSVPTNSHCVYDSYSFKKEWCWASRSQRTYPGSQKPCSMPRRQPAVASAVTHGSLACLPVQSSGIDRYTLWYFCFSGSWEKRTVVGWNRMSGLLAKLSATADNKIFSLMQPQNSCVLLS